MLDWLSGAVLVDRRMVIDPERLVRLHVGAVGGPDLLEDRQGLSQQVGRLGGASLGEGAPAQAG